MLETVLEFLAIVFIFGVGLLVNRRRALDDDSTIPLIVDDCTAHERRSRGTRLLAEYPFALEILYCGLAVLSFCAVSPLANAVSESRALDLLALEQRLHIAIELPLQRYLLRAVNSLIMTLLGMLLLAHTTLLMPAFLVYGYTVFPRIRYTFLRRALALTSILALVISLAWRLTPPRCTPPPLGFLDVLHPPPGYAGNTAVWGTTPLQRLAFSTTPTLHLPAALLMSAGVTLWGRHLLLRLLAPLYPVGVGLAVLATASDWVLGCVAGVVVLGVGLWLNRVLLVLRPMEEWVFAICGVETPGGEEDARKNHTI
ncbi:hypothetical protein C8R45DRAFT_89159 [Mycena sanguinolenta]|nr:hypothetical protein C8R45DRAFT_89159 [Mycena sanguinolenta]